MRLNPGDVIKSVHTGNAFVVEHVSADGHFFILQPEGAEKSRGYNMYDFNRSFVRVSESDTLQAGNSPVIPDGYALVPVKPTKEMLRAVHPLTEATCRNCGHNVVADCEDNVLLSWAYMIAAAPKPEIGK